MAVPDPRDPRGFPTATKPGGNTAPARQLTPEEQEAQKFFQNSTTANANNARIEAGASYGNPDPYAGTAYADPNYGTAAARGGPSGHTDPRDFMYGRAGDYAANTAANAQKVSAANAASLISQGANAAATGTQMGSDMGAYGTDQAAYGQVLAQGLGNAAMNTMATGAGMQGREGATADYSMANSALRGANQRGQQLAGLESAEGPSAAQAQLQSGLNSAQASNLALARSGRGWGGSASAMSNAQVQNAAAGQQAANASAALRAQENAAWRSRQAANLTGAAGVGTAIAGQAGQQATSQAQLQQAQMAQNDQAQIALNQQGLGAYGEMLGANTQSAALGLQGLQSGAATTQAGQTLGMQGTQAAQAAFQGGEDIAGKTMSSQQQGDLSREQMGVQYEGLRQGLEVNAQNQANSAWGTAATVAGTIGAAALMASDERVKTDIRPIDSDGALEMVDAAPGYAYSYRDPARHGQGEHVGPMAQDLMKTPAGASVVSQTPDGTLAVDTGRLALAQHAALHSMRRDNENKFSQLKSEIDAMSGKLAPPPSGEVTSLPPGSGAGFDNWIRQNNVRDLDNPDSHYDYRGAYTGGVGRGADSGHFPDTYKQHGHPTFSIESQYSKNSNDGGTWDGENYHPAVAPKSPDTGALDEAYRRQQTPSAGDFERLKSELDALKNRKKAS